MATINVMGNDAPGIVKEITSAVAEQSIDILTVESEVLSAPFSGAEMFQLQMVGFLKLSCPCALSTHLAVTLWLCLQVVAVPEGTSMIMGREVLIVKLAGVEDSFVNLDIQFDLMD